MEDWVIKVFRHLLPTPSEKGSCRLLFEELRRWRTSRLAALHHGHDKRGRPRALESAADVAIVPLQDVLGLGDEARMNVPGIAGGNWSWRADAELVEAAGERLSKLVKESGR